jgi:C4-dicarboxylate-specific signal transduction histidine kinase
MIQRHDEDEGILAEHRVRAGKVIRRIRDFVRKSEPRRAAVPLAEIVEDTLGIAEIDTRRAGVRLCIDIAPELPPVFADRIMIEQVLLNLIRNAIEAMAELPPNRRTLEVRARRADAVVAVSVVDNGHGIDGEASAMLFTPFFTTKSEGMGRGLNICRSIIEFHDGRLWVEPNPGGGTIFNFTLPMEVVDAPSAQSESRVQRA